MTWSESISAAIRYIEEHLAEPLSVEEIARAATLSPFYFQRGFAMLCGMSVGEYIRKRRLSQAGLAVLASDRPIIDIALDFGYDSPDGFTKAFTRFRGVTPTALRKSGGTVVSFAPLVIKLSLEGGRNMEYRIEKKDAFTVLCRAETFSYEEGPTKVPAFWQEHFATGGAETVRGLYGINIDAEMKGDQFDYLIADPYDPAVAIPDGFTTRTIPAYTWAVFPCRGKNGRNHAGREQTDLLRMAPSQQHLRDCRRHQRRTLRQRRKLSRRHPRRELLQRGLDSDQEEISTDY